MWVDGRTACRVIGVTAAAILVAGTMSVMMSRQADATPQYAQKTGKACGDCHQKPTGGPELTPFGDKFKANGHELPKDPPK